MQQIHQLPEMPPVGRPESYYAHQVAIADRCGDSHLRDASKVGQYLTLGVDPFLPWPQKYKYFDHALRRHCCAPPLPDDMVWLFYRQLGDLVRSHCGEQALRLACEKDEEYAHRIAAHQLRNPVLTEARQFFCQLMTLGHERPAHFHNQDWLQLKLVREQWI